MGKRLIVSVGSACLLALCAPARAQSVPGNCMASFSVKPEKISTDIAWTLATGRSAAMSCGAGELLRQKLFIDGDKSIKERDLSGTPAEAQRRAILAYNNLDNQIQSLPGDDVNGTLFTTGGHLVSKYLLASCLLTVEGVGGTCWAAAISFVTKTYGFFQKVYQDDRSTLRKQQLLAALHDVKTAMNAISPGPADQAGARDRWVQTQTSLCRAIQRDCL